MISPSAFKVEIASVPDREEVVAEVWCGDELFAVLRQEAGGVAVQLYGPEDTKAWELRLPDLLAVLEQARGKLVR
jgi:hypothetical protein